MALPDLVLRENGVPKYVQLREHIAAAIRRGILAPGDRLPTMRQVAVELSIDLNTVQRAYGDLEQEGFLTVVQGRGSFVSHKLPVSSLVDATAFANLVADQAEAYGIALDDLIAALKQRAERR